MLDVDEFMSHGYAKIEQAALRGAADAARTALWQQLGLSPDHPAGWSDPVRWVADLTGQGPFGELVRSPRWRKPWTVSAVSEGGCREARWATSPFGSPLQRATTTAAGTSMPIRRNPTGRGQ